MVALLKSPWTNTFRTLVSLVEKDLMLVSPFIKLGATAEVISSLARRGVQDAVRVQVLTNLRAESALTGSMDLEALVHMCERLPRLELTHLPSLHAKVYLADNRMAVITSGNLTNPGVTGNLEYGVSLDDEAMVAEIRHDFDKYLLLGARISFSDVEALLAEIKELKKLFKKAEQSIRSQARRAFKDKLQATNLRVLRQRARGKTTHGILADTILFLLSKGPRRTTDLHPLIQTLHPDICDDSVDRVIDGVHFGKRWKHYVRNAQQFLKRQGQIEYEAGFWRLTARPGTQ